MRHERNLPFVLLLTFVVSVLVGSASSAGAQDIEELRLAAEQGDADAQFSLGAAYVQGTDVGLDLVEAERWFRRAAEQGHAGAQTVLRELYRFIRPLRNRETLALRPPSVWRTFKEREYRRTLSRQCAGSAARPNRATPAHRVGSV